MNVGDFSLGKTFDFKFTTIDSSGAPITLGNTPVLAAYPDNSTTEITAGLTITVDFDGRTGLHNVRVVATSGNGYATATNYALILTAGTVNGTSVVGYVVGHFSIENRSALRPTTPDVTVDVAATGEVGLDFNNIKDASGAHTLTNIRIPNVTLTDTVTTLTNLPSIPANWLTSAGINAGALNGKGDWLLASSYTAPPTTGQIATGVWTDTTAGDFTTALSVGKSVMNGVALGTGLTVNSLTNLPSIPANWLTAAGIAASALNGKGDWLLASSYTAPPTVGAIATGVWQDSTAGDFTVASSIGKALYINNVAPGAAGGHFIAGTNAATVITGSLTTTFTGNLIGSVGSVTGAVGSVTGAVGSVTGNVGGNVVGSVASVIANVNAKLADGVAHGGSSATLRLGTTGSTPAFYVTSAGSHAVQFESTFADAFGLYVIAPGDAAHFESVGGPGFPNGAGLTLQGAGGSPGVYSAGGGGGAGGWFQGSLNAPGVNAVGGSSGAPGARFSGNTVSGFEPAIELIAAGPNTPALFLAPTGTAAGIENVSSTVPIIGANGINAASLKADALSAIATAVWAFVIETGKTALQCFRLIAAALAGQRTNSGTANEQFDAVGNPGTARIVGNLDSSGNGTPTLTP